MLWSQLPELDTRLAEVPQRNLDTTARSTDHEAHDCCMCPVDVPADDRQTQVERAGHVGLERALEVVRTCGDIQVEQARTQDDADECFPRDCHDGVDSTDEAIVIAVCGHDFSLSGWRVQDC